MDFIFVKSTKANMAEYGSVYARVRVKGQNKKYAIGFTMKETEWLKYRSLQFVSSHLISSIGIKYGQFAEVLSQIKINLENNFNPDKAKAIIRSIKATIVNGQGFEIDETNTGKQILLTDYALKIKEEYESGKRLKQGESRKVSKGHVKNMEKVYRKLCKYMNERRKKTTLDKVDMAFQRDYVKWLSDQGLKQNTIEFYLGKLRVVLSIADEEKLPVCKDFLRKDFIPKREEVENIYLDTQKIDELINADLSSVESVNAIYDKAKIPKKRQKDIKRASFRRVKALNIARDLFIVGCLTGQRYSDFSRICTEMYKTINGIVFIEITQSKTGKTILIPLDKRVDDILKRYNGKVPSQCQLVLNRNLHYLAEILGWTDVPFHDGGTIGGNHNGERFCDLISTHTARRSFATNAYAANIPLASIMAITGHSTEQILRRYLRLDRQEKAIIAAKDFADVIQL